MWVFVTLLFVLFSILECLPRLTNNIQKAFGRHRVPSALGNTVWLMFSHSWRATCLVFTFSSCHFIQALHSSEEDQGFPSASGVLWTSWAKRSTWKLRSLWWLFSRVFWRKLSKCCPTLNMVDLLYEALFLMDKCSIFKYHTKLTAVFLYLWCVRCAPWVHELSPTGSRSSYRCGLRDYWG